MHFWLHHTAHCTEKIVSSHLCAGSASTERVGQGSPVASVSSLKLVQNARLVLPSLAVHTGVTTRDACAADHVVRFTRPSSSVLSYRKQSKTGEGVVLGTTSFNFP